MELLLTCAAVALVIVAFAVSDYLDVKTKALRHSPTEEKERQ